MISANQAGKKSDAAMNSDSDVLKPFLDHIEVKVQAVAQQGRRQITHPFSSISSEEAVAAGCQGIGLEINHPAPQVILAVQVALTNLGYVWEDHGNPDEGNPSSSPYTSISWK